MGKIVITTNASLDGVVQDPDGREGFRLGGWFGQFGGNDLEEWAELETDEALGAEALLPGRRSDEWFVSRWASRSGTWADKPKRPNGDAIFEARELKFLTNHTNAIIEWLRFPGDVLFIAGGADACFVFALPASATRRWAWIAQPHRHYRVIATSAWLPSVDRGERCGPVAGWSFSLRRAGSAVRPRLRPGRVPPRLAATPPVALCGW